MKFKILIFHKKYIWIFMINNKTIEDLMSVPISNLKTQ